MGQAFSYLLELFIYGDLYRDGVVSSLELTSKAELAFKVKLYNFCRSLTVETGAAPCNNVFKHGWAFV